MTLTEIDDATWMRQGNCVGHPTDMFYPESNTNPQALELCQTCPVRVECLTYAMRHHERFGIWGGTSAKKREQLRKQHQQRRTG